MHVAVVGLGFGQAFVPIYQTHPSVSRVSVCDLNPTLVAQTFEKHKPEVRSSLEEILEDDSVDAVHLLTSVPVHAEQTLAVLNAGKHCACAVPMATSLEDIDRIIDATKRSGKTYMMMETAVYSREYFFAKDLRDRGKLGPITFLRGDYYQDLDAAYAEYWKRVPPMHYATHVIGPILALADTRAIRVSCIGGGQLSKRICDDPFNPFPLQTAHFQLEATSAVAQVNRAWYQTARSYVESFCVYGEKQGFEWQQLEEDQPIVFELPPAQYEIRWRNASATRVLPPVRGDLLPAELAPFAETGHGGSHPHLVHEFLSSIEEGRKPWIDERRSADWCRPGICAHLSSLHNGEWVPIP